MCALILSTALEPGYTKKPPHRPIGQRQQSRHCAWGKSGQRGLSLLLTKLRSPWLPPVQRGSGPHLVLGLLWTCRDKETGVILPNKETSTFVTEMRGELHYL